MLPLRKLPLSLALLGLALAAPRAEAVPNLDDFTASGFSFTCSPTCTTVPSPQAPIPTANVLSGQRESQATNSRLAIGSGFLDYSADQNSSFFVKYDFNDSNLSDGGNSFIFDVTIADNLDQELIITVKEENDATPVDYSFTPVVGQKYVPFSDFAGIDFEHVDYVKVALSSATDDSARWPPDSAQAQALMSFSRRA